MKHQPGLRQDGAPLDDTEEYFVIGTYLHGIEEKNNRISVG